MIYMGLSRYTKETLECILNYNPDGIVLGDLFCDKKMFDCGTIELFEMMQTLKKGGISVIYQTPMYVTDRVFSEVVQRCVYFYKEKLIEAIIVQDIGAAAALCEKCQGITLIWGRMGYARTPIINKETLLFYMRYGINSFECKNSEQAEYARRIGADAYLVYGYPSYLTINRECYYCYEHNIFDEDCGLGCLKHEKILFPVNQGIETSIDGYVLGWKHIYDNNYTKSVTYCKNCIIYADTFSEAKERYNEIAVCDN